MISTKEIIQRLLAKGYSCRQIARAADLSSTAVIFIVGGQTKRPSAKTQEKLLKAYTNLAEQAAQRAAAVEEADEKFRRLSGE